MVQGRKVKMGGWRTRNMKWKKRKSVKENIRKEKMKSMVRSL